MMSIVRLAFIITIFVAISYFAKPLVTYASNGEAFVEAFKQKAEQIGGSITIGEEAHDGDLTRLKDFRYVDGTGEIKLDAREVVLVNLRADGSNGFSVDELLVRGFSQTSKTEDSKTAILEIQEIAAANIHYPDLAERENPVWPLDLSEGTLVNIKLSIEGNSIKQEYRSPGLSVAGLSSFGDTGFLIQSLKLQAVSGKTSGPNGNYDMSFGGVELENAQIINSQAFELSRLQIGKFNLEGTSQADTDIGFEMGTIDARNIYAADWSKPNPALLPENGISMITGPAELRIDNKLVLGWEAIEGTNAIGENRKTVVANGLMKRIFLNLDAIPVTRENKQALDSLSELGYQQLTMDLTGKGTWNLGSGDFAVSTYRLDIDDVGTVNFALKGTGYSEALARRVSELSYRSSEETDPEKQQALSLQLLGEMATLSLKEAHLEITDNSALQRVLALQSRKTGQDIQSYQSVVPFLASSMMSPFNVPELANEVRDALSIFMQGNRTIFVRVSPNSPLAITQIMAIAAGARAGTMQPGEVVDRLQLSVEAE